MNIDIWQVAYFSNRKTSDLAFLTNVYFVYVYYISVYVHIYYIYIYVYVYSAKNFDCNFKKLFS